MNSVIVTHSYNFDFNLGPCTQGLVINIQVNVYNGNTLSRQ